MKDKGKIFIDTNILIYRVYGTADQQLKIAEILERTDNPVILSTQVLKEFTNVSIKKKLNKNVSELKGHLSQIEKSFQVTEVSVKTILSALEVKEKYQYSFYDSLILASALENKCDFLYSEDLQHAQIILKKLHIVNPFKK